MINREEYKSQTLNMYDSIVKLKSTIECNKLQAKESNTLKGNLKSFKHNWSKHVTAKRIHGTPVDLEVQKAFSQIDSNLNGISSKLINDGVEILNIYKILETSDKEINALIEMNLTSMMDQLVQIGENLEKTIKISTIKDLENRNKNENLIVGLCKECEARASIIQKRYNRIIDVVEELKIYITNKVS